MEIDLLNKLKKAIIQNRRGKNIKDYYLRKMKKGKSYNAVLIDSLFIKLLFVFIIFLIVNGVGENFALAILSSLFVLVGLIYLSYHIKKQKFSTMITEINDDLGKKRIIKEINYYSSYEFIEYVKSVLEKYYCINFIQLENGDIDLIGNIDGKYYGIKCIRLPRDERVTKKDVRMFQYSLKKNNLERGVLLTCSYFVDGIKDETVSNIVLMDLDCFLTMIKKSNMYPTRKEIEEHILSKHAENKREILNLRERIFTSNKIKKYIFLSISLFLLSKISTYSLYYLIMSTISLLLGIVSFLITIYNILNMKMRN